MNILPAGYYTIGDAMGEISIVMTRMQDVEGIIGDESVTKVINSWRIALSHINDKLNEAQEGVAEALTESG